MSFAVVEFLDDKSVEVVPSSWMIEKAVCLWPSYRALRLASAIKKREEPQPTWTRNSARAMGHYG